MEDAEHSSRCVNGTIQETRQRQQPARMVGQSKDSIHVPYGTEASQEVRAALPLRADRGKG